MTKQTSFRWSTCWSAVFKFRFSLLMTLDKRANWVSIIASSLLRVLTAQTRRETYILSRKNPSSDKHFQRSPSSAEPMLSILFSSNPLQLTLQTIEDFRSEWLMLCSYDYQTDPTQKTLSSLKIDLWLICSDKLPAVLPYLVVFSLALWTERTTIFQLTLADAVPLSKTENNSSVRTETFPQFEAENSLTFEWSFAHFGSPREQTYL